MSNPYQNITCNDIRYIQNLTTSLKKAKERKDIERIVQLSSELERFKLLCGYIQPIREFEESMKRTSEDLGIQDIPEIRRAIATKPQSTKRKFTMQGFDIIEIHPDGTRSYPEPPPEESKSDIPNPLPRRNCDIEREQRGDKK